MVDYLRAIPHANSSVFPPDPQLRTLIDQIVNFISKVHGDLTMALLSQKTTCNLLHEYAIKHLKMDDATVQRLQGSLSIEVILQISALDAAMKAFLSNLAKHHHEKMTPPAQLWENELTKMETILTQAQQALPTV
jgi:hypothetical protein